MKIEDVQEYIFEQRKKYYLSGIGEIGFLFSYKDYHSIRLQLIRHQYNAQDNTVNINGSIIAWSPIVNEGEIKAFIV